MVSDSPDRVPAIPEFFSHDVTIMAKVMTDKINLSGFMTY